MKISFTQVLKALRSPFKIFTLLIRSQVPPLVLRTRDGPDIKNRISSFRISGKPDIDKTFLLLFEDLRCFNYLSNSVKQQTGIEISSIWHPLDIRPEIWYPVLRMAGYPAKLLSSPSLVKSQKTYQRKWIE